MKAIIISLLLTGAASATTVGVLDFSSDYVLPTEVDAIHAATVSALTDFGVYQLVERKNLEEVLKEHKLSASGLTDLSSAVNIGNLLNAEYVIAGSIEEIGGEYVLQLQMVDVEQGRVLANGNTEGNTTVVLAENAHLALYDLLADTEITAKPVQSIEGEIAYVAAGSRDGVLPGMKTAFYREVSKGSVVVPEDVTGGRVVECGDDWCRVEYEKPPETLLRSGDLASFNLREFYEKQAPTGLYLTDKGTSLIGQENIEVEIPQEAVDYYIEGVGHFNRYDKKGYKEAIKYFDKALAVAPDYTKALLDKGDALFNLGLYKESIGCYEGVLAMDADNVAVWRSKGYAYHNLGLFDDALRSYNRTLDLDPKLADVWENKGHILTALGESDEAKRCYEQAEKLK
ncbi:MAG: tetratricopeptide repeat protein [bacterium]|nr:tetratricopeptide repeat protein [bacterium]